MDMGHDMNGDDVNSKNSFIKDIKERPLLIALILAFIAEMLTFAYYEKHIRMVMDMDFSVIMRHMMEIGERRRLFIEGWRYHTGAGFSLHGVMAAILHANGVDIFMAYVIANILCVIIYVIVIRGLFVNLEMEPKFQLLCIILLLCPLNFGIAGYASMIYYNYGPYAYYPIIPILLVSLITTSHDKKAKRIILFAAYSLLLFLYCINTGVYIFICGILPVLVCCFTFGLQDEHKELRLELSVLGVLSFIISVAGTVVSYAHLESMTMGLSDPSKGEALNAIWNFIKMYYYPDETPAFSAEGIRQLLNLLIFFFVVGFGFVSLSKAAGVKDALDENRSADWKTAFTENSMITIFVCNFLILMLTASEPRYHIIGAIPLAICACINLKRFDKKYHEIQVKDVIVIALACVIMLHAVLSLVYVRTDYIHQEDDRRNVMSQIVAAANERRVETVFLMGHGLNKEPEFLRIFDPDKTRNYEAVFPEDGGYEIWNRIFYDFARDRAYFTDKNIFVVRNEENSIEDLPEYIANTYEHIGDIQGEFYSYSLWYSDSVQLDGLVGFPLETDIAIDLPVTKDFNINGTTDKHGWLSSNEEGIVLASPGLYSEGGRAYDIIINYEAENAGESNIELYKDMELVSTIPMEAGEHEAVLDIPAAEGEYLFVVRNNQANNVLLKEIEYKYKKEV